MNRRRWKWLIGGTAALLVVVLLIAGRYAWMAPKEQSTDQSVAETTVCGPVFPIAADAAADRSNVFEPAPAESSLIDDDGHTFWTSPTNGPPLDLAYLPPGVEIAVAVRPAALVAHPEGEKVVAALGPIAADAIHWLKQATGFSLPNIEQLLVGWQVTRDGNWEATLVLTPRANVESTVLDARLAGGSVQQHEGRRYSVVDGLAYYQPEHPNGRVLIVASPAAITDILDLDGNVPPLTRDVERLLSRTDSARHITIICAPRVLPSGASNAFSGELSRLRDPLDWFLGDQVSAALLSLHWDENFFVELLAVPTLDVPPERMADELAERVAELPDRVDEFVSGLATDSYGRNIVTRFPDMVRKFAAYTRHAFDKDCATLRCYLPAIAGHNLLMGMELTLAESAGKNAQLAATTSPKSVRERLGQRTSLRFTRDTLEAALRMLSSDVGVEITIRGQDLQSDGITRNQSFGIDAADKRADEILVQILRLANPDKSATGPSDPRQKLVYVVQPRSPGGPDVVFVTTRSAAQKRGEPLPEVFIAKSP